MGFTTIGFLAFIFVGMTLINRVMEGKFMTSMDISIINTVVIFRPLEIFGLFTVPVPNLEFFTEGIPHLVMWDYSFFGGSSQVIQFFMYSMTAAIAFLCFTIMIGILYNVIGRTR